MLFSHPIGYALNWISSSVDTLFMGYALHPYGMVVHVSPPRQIRCSWVCPIRYTLHGYGMFVYGHTLHGWALYGWVSEYTLFNRVPPNFDGSRTYRIHIPLQHINVYRNTHSSKVCGTGSVMCIGIHTPLQYVDWAVYG
jgi:hypothetical protein